STARASLISGTRRASADGRSCRRSITMARPGVIVVCENLAFTGNPGTTMVTPGVPFPSEFDQVEVTVVGRSALVATLNVFGKTSFDGSTRVNLAGSVTLVGANSVVLAIPSGLGPFFRVSFLVTPGAATE